MNMPVKIVKEPPSLPRLTLHVILLGLCIAYITYAVYSRRSFEQQVRYRCSPAINDNESVRGIGTRHSATFLISNPMQIVSGRRLHRLDFFNQIAVGVRHFHVDVWLSNPSEQMTPADKRVRTIFSSIPLSPYLLTNETFTDYNMLDLIDQFYVYGTHMDGRRSTLHLWIERVCYRKNSLLHDTNEKFVNLVIKELQNYATEKMKYKRRILSIDCLSNCSSSVEWVESTIEKFLYIKK